MLSNVGAEDDAESACMIFASTYPVSDDPTPYENFPYDGPRTAKPLSVYAYHPRPEFDRERAHTGNPWLMRLHSLQGGFDGRGRFDEREHLKLCMQILRGEMEGSMLDTHERFHARKVFDRLDALIGPVFTAPGN